MLAIQIETTDKASPMVRAIGYSIRADRINPIVGRAATNVFRAHLFAADNAHPNALGGSRTHFYAEAARATHFDVVSDGVLISVNQVGIRQRVLGGTIVPKTKKFLTIPARAEAYGKRAREFESLVVVFGSNGQPVALAANDKTDTERFTGRAYGRGRALGGSANKGHAGTVMFWLVKSVTQVGDPSVVPDEAELMNGTGDVKGIKAEVASYVRRAADRALNGGNTR